MANVAPTTRKYPKRTRAEVSYYDGGSDEDEAEEFDSEADTPPASKRLRTSSRAVAIKLLPKKKIFPFNELAPELRNKIYFFALTNGDQDILLISRLRQYRRVISIATVDDLLRTRHSRGMRGRYVGRLSGPRNVPADRFSLVPNLLALNHQVHAETYPILYGANAFALDDTTALYSFCANIGPKNCAALKELTIKEFGYSTAHKALNHPAFTIMASATNLTRLHLDCLVHPWGGQQHMARKFFSDAHHWLEAVGSARGRRDAAVDIVDLGQQNFRSPFGSGIPSGQQAGQSKPQEMIEKFQSELRKLLRA